MIFKKAEFSQYNILKDFLINYESQCVQLSSYLRKNDPNIFYFSEKSQIQTKEDIIGVFYIHGTLLHCFPTYYHYLNNNDFHNSFLQFISDKKIKVLSGESGASDFLVEILKKNNQIPFQRISYKMFSLEGNINLPPVKLVNDEEIRRSTENDFENLLEIQKQYLISEVVPKGKKLTDLELKINLKQILKTQVVLTLNTNDLIVAKVNSNAIGWNFVQIGGVYTNPLYRRNYYAWQLIYNLSLRILNSKRKVCLFVKEKNQPAINLYQQIGFTEYAKYQINYF